jgi:hypothetical protein
MLYVLIVISSVYVGQVVTMQEFTSKENCIFAGNAIKNNSRFNGTALIHLSCVAK